MNVPTKGPTARKAVSSLKQSNSTKLEYDASIELVNGIREAGNGFVCEQVKHWSLPASQVSADFFCSAEHSHKGWYGLLADAAGHGLPSAIFALNTPLLFRDAVRKGLSLPEIYDRIHASLQRQQLAQYFVCGLLVRIHKRDIEVINAGMPDALLLAPDGHVLDSFSSRYLPFGVQSNEVLTEQRHRLARNENAALLLYSDGLIDLGAPAGHPFGLDGVLAAATQGKTEQLVERLVERTTHCGDTAHDDISIVMIQTPIGSTSQAEQPDVISMPHVAGIEAALRIVENFPRALMLTDAEQRILYVNPQFSAITGYTPTEVLGQTPRLLRSGRHGVGFYQQMWQSLRESGVWSGEIWNRRKDGLLFLEWVEIHALRDGSGAVAHYMGLIADITKQRQGEENGTRHLLQDPLTGLANKLLLADRGELAMRRADRSARYAAVLFIDLDRFNTINDSLGHDIGDQVLIAVTQRFSKVMREDDTLARYGSDEFVCLLSDVVQRQDASIVAGKMLASLEEPIEIAGHRLKICASIGISVYPSDSHLLDDLIVLSDRAMQQAKQSGGNIFQFYCAETGAKVVQQLDMEARLHAAIRNNELELHYQPQIDMRTREIVGAEALVRWRDPLRGLIPPGQFIPLAEQSDLIIKIGHWVLVQACKDIARWEAILPENFHVAVNVSPLRLQRGDLVDEVREALATSGIDPARLQLEVTESLFIKDPERAAAALREIVDLGVFLALDDFGTGYSNLASLSNLPLDTFKLDQCFVRNVHEHRGNGAIAKAVWHLADGMKKQLVAEGVENCAECMQLKSFGYRIGQGFKYGKPMAEAAFVAHLNDWEPEHCPCPIKCWQLPQSGSMALSPSLVAEEKMTCLLS